jgi:hypothetical protein
LLGELLPLFTFTAEQVSDCRQCPVNHDGPLTRAFVIPLIRMRLEKLPDNGQFPVGLIGPSRFVTVPRQVFI